MNSSVYEFYYELMTNEERKVYRSVYDGLNSFSDCVSVQYCKSEKLSEIYRKVLYDHPELFFVKTINIEKKAFDKGYNILPQYRFDKKETKYLSEEVKKESMQLIGSCVGKDSVKIEMAIHDYIVKKATYKDSNAPYSHEMPGVFLYGIGVCEGISKAFKYLCDNTGLKSGLIVGETLNDSGGHAWNMICLDGRWYNIDVTYDTNLLHYSGDVRYDYFNVSDDELNDRKSLYSTYKCDKSFDIYKKMNKFAFSQRELKKILDSRHNEKISIQLPKFNCPKEKVIENIMNVVWEDIRSNGGGEVAIYPNYDLDIFTITIKYA